MGPLWTRLAAIPGLLVMTGLLFMWSVSHDAWSADVRAGLHDAYGRLVFDWGKPVRYSFSISGTRATLTFGEPISQDPSQVIGRISPYVTSVTLSDDRKVAFVTLREPFQTQVFTVGDAVVFDFSKSSDTTSVAQRQPPVQKPTPPTFPPTPVENKNAESQDSPPSPQVLSSSSGSGNERSAESQEQTRVRSTSSQDVKPPKISRQGRSVPARGVDVFVSFRDQNVRLTLQWPKRPRYSVRRQKNAITLTFPEQAVINQSALRAMLPEDLRAAEILSGPRRLSVRLPVPEGADVTTGIEGNRVLVDLRIPSKNEKNRTSQNVSSAGVVDKIRDTSAVVPEKMAMRPASEPLSTSGTQQNPRPSPSSDTGQGEATSSTAPEGSGASPPRPSAAARALENAMRARLGLPEPVAPSSPEPPASQDAGATEEKPQPVETTELKSVRRWRRVCHFRGISRRRRLSFVGEDGSGLFLIARKSWTWVY